MKKYISILRGINVSGQKKIRMEDLKSIYESLNFTNVKTYIQSGNVIFCSSIRKKEEIEEKIKAKIFENYNFSVPIILLTINQLTRIISMNPYLKDEEIDKSKLHVTIIKSIPDKTLTEKILVIKSTNDKFTIFENIIYLYCPNGYGRTKLTNNFFENKLKVIATTRNWKSTNKLLEIANEINCGK